jgi:Spy/CpxP family protein refolding chaperone
MRKAIGIGIVAVLIACTAAVVWADTQSWVGQARWYGRRFGGPLGIAARELDLTEAQRKQIGALWKTERPQIAVLVNEFATESVEMRTADHDNADASRVEEIAARQGATVAKLLVEKERLRTAIYAQVLTTEQRTKADAMQRQWASRLNQLADRLNDSEGRR